MDYNIKKAFSLPFNTQCWTEKLLIGGLFVVLANVVNIIESFSYISFVYFIRSLNNPSLVLSFYSIKIILMVIFFLIKLMVLALPVGYILQSAHNEINDQGETLPEWSCNFKIYFKKGLEYLAILLIYGLIIAAICGIPYYLAQFAYNPNNPAIYNALTSTIVLVIIVPVTLLFVFIKPYIITAYAENYDVKQAFRVDNIILKIGKSFPEYLASYGLTLLAIVGLVIISMLLTCTCIGILLIPFLLLPLGLIYINLFSQSYKIAKSK